MKCLTLILLFQLNFVFAQGVNLDAKPAPKPFSIGLDIHLLNAKRNPRGYSIKQGYGETELTDKTNSQLYAINFGYARKKAFVRMKMGLQIDYINMYQVSSSYSGDYSPDGIYYMQSSSSTRTKIVDRNRSFVIGAEIGCYPEMSSSWFKVGASLGVDYTSSYVNKVIDNEIIRSNSSSSNTPSGSNSSSSTSRYDNQSDIWGWTVRKNNLALISPKINLLASFRLSDRLFVEVQAGPRYTFRVNSNSFTNFQFQFPVGVGIRYHIF